MRSDLSDNIINMAEDINLSALLDHPITVNQTIRYICAIKKALLSADASELDDDLTEIERIITRLYEQLGHERRCQAHNDPTYRSGTR